jgi:hypothetical protein
MVLNADELLDDDAMKNGPMTVFWNQDEWVEPNGDPLPEPTLDAWSHRPLKARLLRAKPWAIEMRLAPPPDTDLGEWGNELTRCFGAELAAPPKEGDKAVWMSFGTWARNAGEAVGSAGLAFKKMDGINLSAVQIRVSRVERP